MAAVANNSVEVSVEALGEYQIQEVTLDGQEIYTQPLSMSENLTKLAHKIDFLKEESEEKGKATSEVEKEEEEEKSTAAFQASLWPWDSVRNKLKAALTEMSVLLDVLNIAREKRYMVLDPVSQDPPESKTGLYVVAKKKALQSAASILTAGSDRLKKSQELLSKRTTPDFHNDLFKLRQKWRLKKVGSNILGDLSYKSAGSRFWQNGTFEVTKSETDYPEPSVNQSPPKHPLHKSALQVTVPSELHGVAYIQVVIKCISDDTTLVTADIDLPSAHASIPPDYLWYKKLEQAQNVLFCKEVFAQLAKEAVQSQSSIPHIVVGNQILSHLFPGIQLSIALCHSTGKEKKQSTLPLPLPSPPKTDQNYVLEHSLHQLLTQVHYRNSYHPMPHPVTALLGMSKRRRLAGPQAYTRSELLDLGYSENLLEKIIKQARHIVIRYRAISVIDELAQLVQDPQIAAHCSPLSSATEAMIKVCITSLGFEIVRTSFLLHISVDSMKAVCKDGRVIEMSCETQELKDFILGQVAQHHIYTVQKLSKIMGWSVLSCAPHVGVGEMESVGTAQAILIASPSGDKVLSIKSGPASGIRVGLQKPRGTESLDYPGSVITAQKWANIGGPFQEVHLDKMEGKNFVNKIELLMACLVDEVDAR